MIRGARLHPTARAWLHGCGTKEIGACPGRDPLARPCQCCRGSVGEGNRRERSGRGVEKMNRRADMRGPCGSGGKRRRGGAWAWAMHAGLLAGLATRVGMACCCALAGLAGCCALASRAGRACYGSALLLYLFLFYFLLLCLISNLVLEFKFKNWCTKFIGVLDMRPPTFLYKY